MYSAFWSSPCSRQTPACQMAEPHGGGAEAHHPRDRPGWQRWVPWEQLVRGFYPSLATQKVSNTKKVKNCSFCDVGFLPLFSISFMLCFCPSKFQRFICARQNPNGHCFFVGSMDFNEFLSLMRLAGWSTGWLWLEYALLDNILLIGFWLCSLARNENKMQFYMQFS